MNLMKSFENWYAGGGILVCLLDIVLIILVTVIIDRLLAGFAGRLIKPKEVEFGENNRRLTLRRVVNNLIRYILIFLAFVIILTRLGVNVMSILAAAGVIGLAVSFGAQSLIKDIFAGFFILLENQYGVGEYVCINQTFYGFVEMVGLRVTRLTGDNGEAYILPNGQITDVVNYCRNLNRVQVNFEVAYDTDIEAAKKVLETAAKEYCSKDAKLFPKDPLVDGVTELGSSGITLCVFLYVSSPVMYHVHREFNEFGAAALIKAGIEIPYPVTEVISKEK